MIDEERKDSRLQVLPTIEAIDFDKYEETQEGVPKKIPDYMKAHHIKEHFDKAQEKTIGEIIRSYTTKSEAESKVTTKKVHEK